MLILDTPVLVGVCLFIAVGLLGVVSLLGTNAGKTQQAKNTKK